MTLREDTPNPLLMVDEPCESLSQVGKEGQCCICIEPLEADGANIVLPKCRHVFHSECFLQYTKSTAEACVVCPLCRNLVLQVELPPLRAVAPTQQREEAPPHVQLRVAPGGIDDSRCNAADWGRVLALLIMCAVGAWMIRG